MTEAHGGAGRAKEETSAVEIAALFANFVDVLIPGDERWPTASVVGVQAVLATRLVDLGGEGEIDRLVTALLAAGAPFTGKVDAERRAIVAGFERAHDGFLGLVRNAVYLAYYESPPSPAPSARSATPTSFARTERATPCRPSIRSAMRPATGAAPSFRRRKSGAST